MSVRLGVRSLSERWERTALKLDRDNCGPGLALTGMAKDHSSEAFFGCDDPLEAMVLSALVEIHKKRKGGDKPVDP